MSNKSPTTTVLTWIGALLVLVPAIAIAGLTAQGLTAQGLTAQGLTAQGLTAQGLTAQGLTAQGLTAQGLTAQGLTAQGLTAQGLTAQGLTAQGLTAQGVSVMGSDIGAAELKGVAIHHIEMRGTLSTDESNHIVELTGIPSMSTGTGNYITVDGGSAVGHYARAHMAKADGTLVTPSETFDLFVAGEQKDPNPNLFHRASAQDNHDELYTVYFFHQWSGQWVSLCPFDPRTRMASAMAIPENPATPKEFIFACTATGVASKCARNWGYQPWAQTSAWQFDAVADKWVEAPVKLKDYYDACTIAARAGYCQDGQSFTKQGTLIDLFDTSGVIWPNAIENPFNAANPDSMWMMAQEYFISTEPGTTPRMSALQRTRYRELSPVNRCTDTFAQILRLEHDHLEDGRWANPSTKKYLQVFSPTSCTHNEDTTGKALPWDCSPCTTAVCKTLPQCCGAGAAPTWGPACTTEAAAVCKDDDGVRWPLGRVWPDALPAADAAATVASKYLFGAGGAVERVDGVSGLGTSATVSGWACDPEWPGTTVAVRVYDRPREQAGAVVLGDARADLAVATPLAREVSAACDSVGLSNARHGFSVALPANQQGNVFVYAMDAETADGPAAPPTLIRNGIVHVPSCAHSEHEAGPALAAACSACATSVCADGSHGSCCLNEWTVACAEAANACAVGTTSAAANSRRYASIATGWLEPTVDGDYVFESALQPSRLFVNGAKVLDWWDGPGTTEGTIHLSRGTRVHLRWDRFQAEPPATGAGQGLTWRAPGSAGQTAIPASQLYRLTPATGSGLTATYFPLPAFGGLPAPVRLDALVDISASTAPPAATPPIKLPAGFGPSYSVRWEGDVVSAFSDDYTFYVTGSGVPTLKLDGVVVPLSSLSGSPPPAGDGCSHNLCELGEKLAASVTGLPACNDCVDKVCAKDSYCCDGGYLSYYSFEPQWDARCVTEVQTECGITCTNPLPTPTSPERYSTTPKALQAGVHHTIELSYTNGSGDPTVQLAWSSAREAKHAIPTPSLFPKVVGPASVGSGLNVTLFATKMDGGVLKPDLATPVASGAIADLAIAPVIGLTGTPLLPVLAAPADVAAATPRAPLLDRPRLGDSLVSPSTNIEVHGIGGIKDGSVRIRVAEFAGTDVLVPVAADGTFTANVDLGGYGPRTLTLLQRTFSGAACVPPNPCLESATINWPMTLVKPAAAAPEITSPTDPTHNPNPADNVIAVKGRSFRGATITVHETGGNGASTNPPSFVVGATGLVDDKLALSAGSSVDPTKGWHRLTFDQGGVQSPPVFVSVGIQPPTLEFPRTGAVLDCSQPDAPDRTVKAKGTLPYSPATFPFRIFEETGRQRMREVAKETSFPSPLPPPGQPINFETTLYNLSYGRHLVYFFQAPEPPQGVSRDEHFRNFASIADTPQSRIEINIRPPRLADVSRVITRSLQQASVLAGPGLQNCVPGQSPPYCAQPNADVNVKVGSRVFTTRANQQGGWFIEAPLAPGWNDVSVSQVVDSEVGGGWQESCPSETLAFPVETSGTITVHVPPDKTVEATSRQGAVVTYAVSAESRDGNPVTVACIPPSASTFPVGRTVVLCKATDLKTGEMALGRFAIDVIDGPPVLRVPSGGLDAEADSSLGAMVNFSGAVSAADAVSGPLPVQCAPSSPALFLLDLDSSVTCSATDEALQTTTASFVVRVRDTTPPALCLLPNLNVPATSAGGAVVTYTTCAKDVVDGATPVTCDRPSGSVFPLGKTAVTCRSSDRHGNRSPASSFTVTVKDVTAPVLKLPSTMTVVATSRNGAKVKYTATATDSVDPKPKVSCTPKSDTIFPLGKTTVKCTATDASGNQSTGTFLVKVVVQWGGMLPPIAPNGSARFTWKKAIAVAFGLTGPSYDICDLPARLFVAPLDAAGKPGAEVPARRVSGSGNLFDFVTAGHKYLLNLDTKPLAVGGWQLRVDLGDGESHVVKIALTK